MKINENIKIGNSGVSLDALLGHILYENNSHEETSGGTINLGKNYNFVDVIAINANSDTTTTTIRVYNSTNVQMNCKVWLSGIGDLFVTRNFMLNGTVLQFWNANGFGIGNTSNYYENVNECLIPIKIIA